jgi:hypothetical protein
MEDRPIYKNYQWWECKSCGKKYFAILEESKVDIFDDTLEHQGYFANEDDWQKSYKWALQCPDSKNVQCQCQIHQQVPPEIFFGAPAWYTNE